MDIKSPPNSSSTASAGSTLNNKSKTRRLRRIYQYQKDEWNCDSFVESRDQRRKHQQ